MAGDLRRNLRDIRQDEEGKFTFTGDTLRISGSDDERRRSVIRLSARLVLIAACCIGSGCIDAAGASDAFYVILPFIGEMASLFILAWNMIRLLYGSSGIRDYIYESASRKVPGACRMLAAFAAAGFILSVIYIFRNGWGGSVFKSIAYLLLKIAAAGLSLWYDGNYSGVTWERS